MEVTLWNLHHGSSLMELTALKLPHGTYTMNVTSWKYTMEPMELPNFHDVSSMR